MPPIHLETICSVLRAGRFMLKHGDDYELSGTVIFEDKGVVRIVGTSGNLYKGFMAEVKAFAKDNGIHTVIWERRKNGKEKKIILNIPTQG